MIMIKIKIIIKKMKINRDKITRALKIMKVKIIRSKIMKIRTARVNRNKITKDNKMKIKMIKISRIIKEIGKKTKEEITKKTTTIQITLITFSTSLQPPLQTLHSFTVSNQAIINKVVSRRTMETTRSRKSKRIQTTAIKTKSNKMEMVITTIIKTPNPPIPICKLLPYLELLPS